MQLKCLTAIFLAFGSKVKAVGKTIKSAWTNKTDRAAIKVSVHFHKDFQCLDIFMNGALFLYVSVPCCKIRSLTCINKLRPTACQSRPTFFPGNFLGFG